MNNIFGDLIEIKTGRNDLIMKAVYISDSTATWQWTYFIYYYDLLNHTFYINNIDNFWNYNTGAINIIEDIVNEAYKQEMNALNLIVKKLQTSKKPNIICISKEAHTWLVMMEKISLESVRARSGEIISFKNLKKEYSLEKTLELVGLKNSWE